MVDISEYQLPSRPASVATMMRSPPLKQSFDDVQLAHYAGVVLVFLPLTLLAGDEREWAGSMGRFSCRKPANP